MNIIIFIPLLELQKNSAIIFKAKREFEGGFDVGGTFKQAY